MRRTQILLTEKQHKILKELAKEKKISMAEAVRECVEYYNANAAGRIILSDEDKCKRALAAAGRFKSGFKDLSVNHDKYLEESFKE